MIYLVTFSCYGTHLPGDIRGSFDHLRDGERKWIAPNPALEAQRRKAMLASAYELTQAGERSTVLQAIIEVCRIRNWFLYALHIRPSHLHGLIESGDPPSRLFHDWKAYATRALRALPNEPPDRRYWTHGGSAHFVQTGEDLRRAKCYVLEQQGEPMERYSADPRFDTAPQLARLAWACGIGTPGRTLGSMLRDFRN